MNLIEPTCLGNVSDICESLNSYVYILCTIAKGYRIGSDRIGYIYICLQMEKKYVFRNPRDDI